MTIKRKKATKSFFWRKKIVPKLGKWDIFLPKTNTYKLSSKCVYFCEIALDGRH